MILSSIKKIIPIVSAVLLVVVEFVAIYYVLNAEKSDQINEMSAPTNQEVILQTPDRATDGVDSITPNQNEAEPTPQNRDAEEKSTEPVDPGNSTVENLPEVPFPIQ